MKGNYKNWVPDRFLKYMKSAGSASIFLFAFIAVYILYQSSIGAEYNLFLSILSVLFLIIGIGIFIFRWKMIQMYKEFNLDDPNSICWKIINYVADSLDVEEGDKVLDVGCGSGALSVTFAKKNPKCNIVGADIWSDSFTGYREFSKELCESNAKADGVDNVSFEKSDARELIFEDESFNAVISNFVYHNIPGDRQKLLLETFRVLKKGGKFAINDIFTKQKYGNMDAFVEKLLADGFEKVELIDIKSSGFIDESKLKKLMLNGSKLLIGRK